MFGFQGKKKKKKKSLREGRWLCAATHLGPHVSGAKREVLADAVSGSLWPPPRRSAAGCKAGAAEAPRRARAAANTVLAARSGAPAAEGLGPVAAAGKLAASLGVRISPGPKCPHGLRSKERKRRKGRERCEVLGTNEESRPPARSKCPSAGGDSAGPVREPTVLAGAESGTECTDRAGKTDAHVPVRFRIPSVVAE